MYVIYKKGDSFGNASKVTKITNEEYHYYNYAFLFISSSPCTNYTLSRLSVLETTKLRKVMNG